MVPMTTHLLTRRLAPFCVLLASATACGADDPAMSTADYQKAANAVCADAEANMAPIFGEIFPKLGTATEEERLTATNGLLAVIDKQIDDLAALEPPSDISDDVDAMLDTARTAADTVREQGAGFWLEESDPFTEVNQRAAALGLDACAGDSAS